MQKIVPFSLITEQKATFEKAFGKRDNTWKILIFDKPNLEIINSLFKVKDFRQNNITLYFNINDSREQLHGVTAIYLVKPIQQNVDMILKDFEKQLYSSISIHFTSEPTAFLLSGLAKSMAQKKPSLISRVQAVEFSCVGFQCLGHRMAVLPDNSDLLNLLFTLKEEPIFIYGDSQADKVEFLKARLQSSRHKLGNNESKLSSKRKYIFVLLFDRELDMFPIMSHGIEYSNLMEQIWSFNHQGTKVVQKEFRVNLNDHIWMDRKNMMTTELNLDKDLQQINTRISNAPNGKLDEFSQEPEKKKNIEMHLDFSQELIKEASLRKINTLHMVELQLYTKKALSGQNRKEFIELLANSQVQKADKIRLMVLYLLCVEHFDLTELEKLESQFREVTQNKYYSELRAAKTSKNNSQENAHSKYLKKFAKGLWNNLLNSEKKYLLVKYLDRLKALDWKFLGDLGMKTSVEDKSTEITEDMISHTVVHCIGGINFNESTNVQEFHPDVIYTGDMLLSYRDLIFKKD